MNILLAYPAYPKTYWSFHYALKFISKKANLPPLGLLTIAALLPDKWVLKLVDMNVEKLTDADIKWADYVFVSAMEIQKESVAKVLERCKSLGAAVVAGGPLFTMEPGKYNDIAHLVLGEGEITLPMFVKDVERGTPKHIYTTDEHPDIKLTPPAKVGTA
jgi:radical SAM superfamily enzyme YgiQ (UPF0313 family)